MKSIDSNSRLPADRERICSNIARSNDAGFTLSPGDTVTGSPTDILTAV
jgi:hypothetical protein